MQKDIYPEKQRLNKILCRNVPHQLRLKISQYIIHNNVGFVGRIVDGEVFMNVSITPEFGTHIVKVVRSL